ncbi:MAG: leucyl aminopeptidase [Actinomycetota bacterium]|nr:leucyl aminopeptidase [Actinomycetota bacterium]
MALDIVWTTESATEVAADVVVVGATSSGLNASGRAIDGLLDGALSKYLSHTGFKAKVGSTTIVPTLGRAPSNAVAVVGLGDATASEVRRAAAGAARKLAQHSNAASALHEDLDAAALESSVEGWHLGNYRFKTYKSDPRPPKLQRITLVGTQDDQSVERATARASATITARDLINEPASALWPEVLAERAREVADVSGLEYTAWDENELAERGFGGLLGVAQGSRRPPRLIQLRYAPRESSTKVALVGKGVTFDSGGLSLKDAKSMETMKTDMGGGAAVIGAMGALRKLGVTAEVLGFIPTTENMPGGAAIKPGDVITHYGGKTSEVLNTDAEGRLILADALAYASEQRPDAIVDVATLTGAMMVALGKKAAGYFANDDDLARDLEAAATAAGERIWRMPLYDDYRSDLDSDIADLKNIGQRWGGAIYAALFLRDFVGRGISWGHLDIAGPGRSESDYDDVAKGGTGFAARTLVSWLERIGRSS